MNPQTIGRIDRLVGRPVCALLTVARRISALVLPRRARQPIRKILFLKMIEQGATVLAYRAMMRAIEIVGRENVYFWVFAENRPILDLMDLIPPENILQVRSKKLTTFVLDVLGTLFRIRKHKIDATVDMEFFARAPAILAFLTGAKRRVGLHRYTNEGPYRGDLLTHRVQYNPYLHTAVAYYELVEALTANPDDRPLLKLDLSQVDLAPPRFVPRDEEIAAMRQLLGEHANRRLVLLNANSSDLLPLRKWPTDRFIELGKRILARHDDVSLIITGAISEQPAAEEIARQIDDGRVFSVAGRTTLRELLALYTIADVLVTNDSGPGHFASLTPVDSIVLFGPETPALFGPVGDHSHAIWRGLACSPCVNALNHRFSPCSNNVCMQEITVEQVLGKVNELLERRSESATKRGVELTIFKPRASEESLRIS